MEWSDLPKAFVLTVAIIAVCGGVYGLLRWLGYFSTSRSGGAGEPTMKYQAQVLRDWMTTGRINFAGDWQQIKDEHTPHLLYVQVEETRVTENIGGSTNIEIRWRQATLGEAKQIVSRYHRFLEEHPDMARVDDASKVTTPAFT